MGYTTQKAKGIEINGKEYPFDPGDESMIQGIMFHFPNIIQKLQESKGLSEQLTALMAKASAAQGDGDTLMEEMNALRDKSYAAHAAVIESCKVFLHGTLGVDEYKEIFAGQRINMMRLFDLCHYVYEWAMSERAGVIEKYIDMPEGAGEHAVADAAE